MTVLSWLNKTITLEDVMKIYEDTDVNFVINDGQISEVI